MKRLRNYVFPRKSCPLIENLTIAIKHGYVDRVKDLFSKSLIRKRNEAGFTLLQESILRNRRSIFEYLLQFHDKDDLEVRSTLGETALRYALGHYNKQDEYYALVLIERGVSLKEKDPKKPYLHDAVKFSSRITKFLLDNGADVNFESRYGITALQEALFNSSKQNNDEIITTLLCYGADPFSELADAHNVFESAVIYGQPAFIQELLFLYTFDEHIPCDIMFKVLLILAKKKSPLFHTILERGMDILVNETEKVDFAKLLYDLLAPDSDYLEILVEKCNTLVSDIFENLVFYSFTSYPPSCIGEYNKYEYEEVFSSHLNLRKLILLLEKSAKVRQSVIDFISTLKSNTLFHCISEANNKSITTELFIYLILHGLKIETKTLETVFWKYGYNDLFKLLLHMDLEDNTEERDNTMLWNHHSRIHGCSDFFPQWTYQFDNLVLVFIFYVIPNLELKPDRCTIYNVNGLLDCFACSEVHKLLSKLAKSRKLSDETLKRLQNHPRVPLLAEIARNVFRKYFMCKFNITTAKQFYSLLNGLPISSTHKKVITLETKLYQL
ncbi:hypothetical protein Zmor_024357 [Zophobas morio]|uniref:SOCS box domain-containing protein n=1 Tax=Zophobas morio TaxID=2755281 RepID=A0AA38I0F9_9CUCU|nr:hypothetical protein Zmor_024357 [Zophobas morio]